MTRSLTMRCATPEELDQLHRLLKQPLQPWQHRRLETVLLHTAGHTAVDIAALLGIHVNTVYSDLRLFHRRRVRGLLARRRIGAPPRLTAGQRRTICRLAEQSPPDLGRPYGRWSLAKLRDYLISHRIVRRISREHLRRVLKKGGYTFRRIARKLWCKDANRRRILHRLRKLWQNKPRGTVLLFFDVKPVAVKAYGGRRYSKKRLVLSRGQKTHGLFYLFVAYEHNSGRRLWGFYPGKSSRYVCYFLKKIRSRYGKRKLRLALDRDSPHPIKCARTRRQMRTLGIGWTSLPKGNPDDNPVETLFSDVQQMVLDTSSDTNPAVTRGRISRHLQACNRRADRRIRVSYLEIPPKVR